MIRSLIYFFFIGIYVITLFIWVFVTSSRILNKIENAYPSGFTRVHRSCCSIFSFLCSVLKIVVCPSGQTKDHKTIRFVFTSSCLWAGSCLIYDIRVCLRIVVSNKHCVVFLFCLSSFCIPYVVNFSGLSICDCQFGIL